LDEWRLLAGFSLIQLHLKREAAPMAASQNWTDGQRPSPVIATSGFSVGNTPLNSPLNKNL
jgi:hypothetical protein